MEKWKRTIRQWLGFCLSLALFLTALPTEALAAGVADAVAEDGEASATIEITSLGTLPGWISPSVETLPFSITVRSNSTANLSSDLGIRLWKGSYDTTESNGAVSKEEWDYSTGGGVQRTGTPSRSASSGRIT